MNSMLGVLARVPLFKLYRRLRTDIHFTLPEAPTPAAVAAPAEDHESVAVRVLSERAPAALSHADFVDVDEEYTPAAPGEAPPDAERSAPGPPAPARRPRGSRGAETAPGKYRGVRRRISDFVYRLSLVTRLTCAAVAIAGTSYGMMYLINRQAHRSAEPIRQLQQQTGKAAEDISADPSRAPIDNKARSATSPMSPESGGR